MAVRLQNHLQSRAWITTRNSRKKMSDRCNSYTPRSDTILGATWKPSSAWHERGVRYAGAPTSRKPTSDVGSPSLWLDGVR